MLHGRPLISYALGAACEAGLEAVVVAKHTSELPELEDEQVSVIHEPDEPRHPLCGILAALRECRAPVLAVGCDMPFLSGELLAWLAGSAASATNIALELKGRVQPLPALYGLPSVGTLGRALAAEASLQATLAQLAPRVLSERELSRFGEPSRLCFSVNDAGDLRTASRWAQS